MWRVEANVNFNQIRRYNERINPLETLSDEEFFNRYRFPKNTVSDLCDLIRRPLQRVSNRGMSLTIETMVCSALRYYCQGGYLPVIGDLHGISERAASKSIHSVSEEICRINGRYIHWGDENYLNQQQNAFSEYCGMRRTIGCVDGCHIPIIAPVDNEPIYVNRKGFHSIN